VSTDWNIWNGWNHWPPLVTTEADFAKQVIGKYTKTTDAADLENSYQTFLPAWERLPLVPAAALQTMLNFATHPGAKTARPETFIDNFIFNEIGKSGFVDRLYISKREFIHK
jgi:hypothetical protein